MGEFRMPSLGADMEFGTVVEWRVAAGDEVSRGDIVAVVDTDKADIDVEIFESGVIEELLVPVGERVEVGTPLARVRPVGAEAATAPATAVAPAAATPAITANAATTPAAAGTTTVSTLESTLESPVLRRLATHLGVDPATVTGTGPGGEVTRGDVEAAAAARDRDGEQAGDRAGEQAGDEAGGRPDAGGRPEEGGRPGRAGDRAAAMRQAIADLMARSKREIPHYYVATDVDMTAALAHLDAVNAERSVSERLLPAALSLKAAALAARRVPALNGTWVDGAFHPSDHVHLGVAVRLRGGGLVAPALHDADELPLAELMRRLQDLVQRARTGHLRSSEMSDPTLTVTQLGDQGVDTVIGVIYPPQVALVGLGRITERPWAADGMVGARPVLRATLAADHRATDGITGARYLDTFDHLLQRPEEL